MSLIQIYDTTLRDGTQSEGFTLSGHDKIRVAQRLDDLGVAFIEGGWPGSNPKDAEFFERARDLEWKTALIAAFGSTCRVKGGPEDDANIQALIAAQTPVCTLFGKTWNLHVTEVLLTTLDDNLRIIEQSIAYLRAAGRRVIYDAEHFFDGYQADPSYALETLKAAIRGGAETVVLCDTNGGSLPWDVETIVREMKDAIQHPFGIHTHNDGECAVVNALTAVRQGAIQVQGTINGVGERCGNANLCSVMANLELKMGRRCLPEGGVQKLYELSHVVDEVANVTPNDHLPYVGKSAFAHKGGVHVAAMRRCEQSYQHVAPEQVGNKMRVVVSALSGRANILSKAEEHGVDVSDAAGVVGVLNDVKDLEARGFSFEAAEASVAMMLKRQQPDYRPLFELIDFLVNVEHRQGRGIFAEAMVKVKVGAKVMHTAAEGNGPVNALDIALRKALLDDFPQIASFHLADYKVRILDGQDGTEAITRVLIDTRNTTRMWSTVGASANIIEASWQALVDAVEYGLSVAH
ncbi:MAG TPA: citramalate synthase [Candidatus Competibacter sp.]|nr:citramalate synthase [Candidatus Competibacter sp.]HUM94156.1 citramalate synthase [Candidatus Competibacter sp.]